MKKVHLPGKGANAKVKERVFLCLDGTGVLLAEEPKQLTADVMMLLLPLVVCVLLYCAGNIPVAAYLEYRPSQHMDSNQSAQCMQVESVSCHGSVVG